MNTAFRYRDSGQWMSTGWSGAAPPMWKTYSFRSACAAATWMMWRKRSSETSPEQLHVRTMPPGASARTA